MIILIVHAFMADYMWYLHGCDSRSSRVGTIYSKLKICPSILSIGRTTCF